MPHITVAQSAPEPAIDLLRGLDALSVRQDLSTQARAQAFLALVEPGFNLDHMATTALDPEARPEGADDGAYRAAYRAHMVQAYLRSVQAGATRSEILAIRSGEAGTLILIIRVRTAHRTDDVTWLGCSGHRFRVCDVESNGARLSSLERDTFGTALRRLGWDGFLAALRRGELVGR